MEYTPGNSSRVQSSPSVFGGKVYVAMGLNYDHKLYCLDAATGAFIWSYSLGSNGLGYVRLLQLLQTATSMYPQSTVSLLFERGDGSINLALRSKHHWFKWFSCIADGKLYLGTGCLDAATGALIWRYTTGSQDFSSAVVAEGKVYMGSGSGRVYCFGPRPLPNPVQTPERWAIIVGVSDYQYISPDLNYSDDDAISLYNRLAPTWGTDHIKLLIDANATKAAISNAITIWLSLREDSDDTVLFYFSGRGGQTNFDRTPLDKAITMRSI